MRHIKRGQAPHYIKRSHENPPTNADEAESRWGSFSYKEHLTFLMCMDQYGLCGYTELRPDEEGIGTHIEHVKPKRRYPEETFNYQNLIVCALSSEDKSRMSPDNIFGGHAKLGRYDPNRFISCLTAGCDEYFAYLSDGRVVPKATLSPAGKDSAQYTIDVLNLNCEYLKNRRKNWIDELDQLIAEHIDSPDALKAIADVELGITYTYELDPNIPVSRLRGFHTAARQRFGRLGQRIIEKNYPELL